MRVRALRGVCIGVDRHLKPGDTEDLDAGQVTFLVGIGAVEVVPEPPQQLSIAEDSTDSEQSTDSKESKDPQQSTDSKGSKDDPADPKDDKDHQQSKAGRSGKKDSAAN